jgi:hypothetical protein
MTNCARKSEKFEWQGYDSESFDKGVRFKEKTVVTSPGLLIK